jgi:hypothetical protein
MLPYLNRLRSGLLDEFHEVAVNAVVSANLGMERRGHQVACANRNDPTNA